MPVYFMNNDQEGCKKMNVQVSLSSNFSKPVIHVVNPADMVYDVFSNISFSSPLSTSGTDYIFFTTQ